MNKELRNLKYVKERLTYYLSKITKKTIKKATNKDWYDAFVAMINNELLSDANETESKILNRKNKFVAYLSMEYLLGTLGNQTLLNLKAKEIFRRAFDSFGVKLDDILALENETQLGNGGLGRLAACFFESLATLDYPAFGYGLFYRCGIYKQIIQKGMQVEKPDLWIKKQNLCVDKRKDISYDVNFGGKIVNGNTIETTKWVPSETVKCMANDILLAGYEDKATLRVRLWEAERKDKSAPDIKKTITNITDFLYPPDTTNEGRRLRLRQEYVLVSASVQDLFVRFRSTGLSINKIDEFMAVQLNDTHPTLAIPEIIRILMNDYCFSFDEAYKKMYKICAYTNHTLMAEALEKIGIDLFKSELPYHYMIIEKINSDFMNMAKQKIADWKLNRVEIINYKKGYVNMGNLCMVATHKVNGVAELHSKLLKKKEFPLISQLFPRKFINETNGITQRKWLLESNPELSNLINKTIGDDWINNSFKLKGLLKYKNDEAFLEKFAKVKKKNKEKLFAMIKDDVGITLSSDFILDSQIKRIHEYKRQFLNILQVIDRYNRICDGDIEGLEPKICLFAGKAPPTYDTAKDIVSLINDVANVVNNDKRCKDLLKVVFVPNYNIGKAQLIIPATNISEQISTAGKEASGTGNMKFALNGALTIGTLDGANVEIRKNVGAKNIFIFGLKARQVYRLKEKGYDAQNLYNTNPRMIRIIEQIKGGVFSKGDKNKHDTVLNAFFNNNDEYMVLADFNSYVDTQLKLDKLYTNQKLWWKKAVINVANCGFFSSDRTIENYAKDIWKIKEIKE